MEKQTFKVIEYINEKGEEKALSFECTTPHILISGDRVEDILALEKKMLKNLSESNGKEINLVVVDEKLVLPEDFFSDLKFNHVSRITEEEAICHFSRPLIPFAERFLLIYRNEVKTFTALNESGREHLKMLVYVFPLVSDNKELHKLMDESGKATEAGVHVIAGIDYILDNPPFTEGCDIRISFPSCDVVKDIKFFRTKIYELPSSGELWFKEGAKGDVRPIALK